MLKRAQVHFDVLYIYIYIMMFNASTAQLAWFTMHPWTSRVWATCSRRGTASIPRHLGLNQRGVPLCMSPIKINTLNWACHWTDKYPVQILGLEWHGVSHLYLSELGLHPALLTASEPSFRTISMDTQKDTQAGGMTAVQSKLKIAQIIVIKENLLAFFYAKSKHK